MATAGAGGLRERIAGAPISWGVCEVPGWGHQMSRARVLAEMREVGLAATEFGPDGFLPRDPDSLTQLLSSHDMRAVGGFVPVVLHDPAVDVLAAIAPALDAMEAVKAGSLVLSADTGEAGYDSRFTLDDAGWSTLRDNLARIDDAAAARGITATLHPHVGTVVERGPDVARLLADTDMPLCLDTGHLLIGGTDPAELAASFPGRIAHVHLKDVDGAMAARVRAGGLAYSEAVARGMYRPLGAGDVDIARIVRALETHGFDGWYVMEQDAVLDAEPPAGQGPIIDVRASLAYLEGLAS